MRLDEIVEVLAANSTSDFSFRPEATLLDPGDILTICATLVTITEGTIAQTTGAHELRLAHFSVKKYLISERLKKMSTHRYHITSLSANVLIAKTCLTYLHFESPISLMDEAKREFPFIEYAARF